MQNKRAKEGYKQVKKHIEENELMQVQTFTHRNKIDIERTKYEDIMQWMHNVKNLIKKVERLPTNDIRRHCEC